MSLTIMLMIGGCFHVAFAVFHLLFWRLFDWKNDLSSLRWINRQVMQILNLCLTFVFLIFAYVSFFHAEGLLSTSLGHTMLLLISVFWLLRAVEQVVSFRLRAAPSAVIFIVFVVGVVLYGWPWLAVRGV